MSKLYNLITDYYILANSYGHDLNVPIPVTHNFLQFKLRFNCRTVTL